MKNFFLILPLLVLASVTGAKAQLPTMAQAVDGPGFAWTRLGNTFATLTTTNAALTHDGVDCYITGPTSGSLTNSEKSGQQTRVAGPGTLTFWWRVSSELGFDTFGFWIGLSGGVHAQQDPDIYISGPNEPWEFQTFQIPPGTNFLEWVYVKDESDSDGTDKGYLDEVFFTPDPPTITVQPEEETTIVPAGTNVSFSVEYVEGHFPGVPKQTKLIWQLNGADLAGKTNSTLALTNVQTSQSGEYRVVITNLYGKCTSEVAVLEVFQPYPLNQALDTTNLVWTTSGGDALWFGLPDPDQSHDGIDVARSGVPPEDFEQLTFSSYLQTTVTGPGTLRFWWKLSGLDTDQFYMSVNTFIKTNVPPEDGSWQEETIGVPTGVKPIKFTYLRDDFISTDDTDGAYLDQVRFIPATNAPPIFSAPILDTNGFSAIIQLDPSRAYTIQKSTNLVSWTNVISFTHDDNLYQFVDPSATNLNAFFYRIKSP